MRVAEILSDLTSLRASDPNAALALVTARPPAHVSDVSSQPLKTSKQPELDSDLARAQDLLDLHANVKVGRRALDQHLLRARQDVKMALRTV